MFERIPEVEDRVSHAAMYGSPCIRNHCKGLCRFSEDNRWQRQLERLRDTSL
jgi:hypothetical protein